MLSAQLVILLTVSSVNDAILELLVESQTVLVIVLSSLIYSFRSVMKDECNVEFGDGVKVDSA